jgi:tRNA(Ile)-lysidine synthase
MALQKRVLRTIQRHGLMRRGDRVLVALSGGPDSVALVRLLRELEARGELAVAGVAHLNHRLRDAAGRDEQFCCAFASEMGLTFRSTEIDVRARAEALGTSLEDAGRQARYEWFERVAVELGAHVIATGHTLDDQAETFLLRLLRGAGPRGLAGIHPRAGRVIRPLLEIGRAELREYLAVLEQPFCEDETNRDLSIPRNRIRHELLPLLQRDYSPGISDVLAREAAIARLDEDRLGQEAIDLADSIVLTDRTEGIEEPETVTVDARALGIVHPALAVRVARLALNVLAPGRFVGYEHVERLLELARHGSSGGALSLPGQHATRRGDAIVLRREAFQPFSNPFHVSLSIPGEVILEPQGWAVSATWECVTERPGSDPNFLGSGLGDASDHRDPLKVRVWGLTPPLAVRSRKPGDRFKPFGMGGQGKKLQDFLVDRKVARERRDSLPLVVDSADRIVWVVGESVAEDFRVTGPSQGVIFLKARRLGGQG